MPQNYFFNNCESLVDLKDICPPLSVVMPVQCAWKTLEKAAAVAMNGQESYHLSETDFPFLDLKPEVDEFKVNKGRRNANEQLMKKKLAGQAFVLKQVVGQNGQCKVIGKKRRARLLSENNEDMKLNVPYSLNRKGRWELESAADCLKEQQSDENVQLSALDQHLTAKGLSPSKEILAFHQVNENGAMSSRKAQSKCGATLSELNATASDEKPLNIRYVMAKAHPHNKGLIAGSLDKAKPLPRSTKRAQLDISVYSTDGGETTEDETHLISPQAEETIEMYKPKNYTTYSLADFVHDKKDSALVRTRSRRVPLDSYVQVEMPEVQEGSESTSLPTSPLNKIGQSMSLMKTLHVPSQLLGVTCRDNWLQQCTQLAERPELRFQFLNAAQCSFQIDVTPVLTTSKTPHLVLTLANDVKNERVRLIFNRSQECQINWRTLDAAFAQQMNGFDELLQTVVKNSKITLKEQSALPKHLSSEFNSTQLSAQVSPLDNYSLLYGAKPAVVAKSAPIEENDEEDGEFNDFEYIAMDQFVDSDQVLETKWRDAILDEQVAQMKTLCDECGENDTTKILLLDQCGHSYCFRCLKASLYQQICENVPLLSCSSNGCSNEIPSILLQSIFELPVVAMTLQSCAESKAKKLDQQVFVCPTGCGIAILDPSSNKLGQVQCDTCKNHFCFNCHKEPHWPLSCAQNETWSRKRELQSRNESDDATKNEISQQYWTVCNDARKRRTDLQATRKVAKDVLKKVGYKLERQFSELRKACLQVVENGYAFLYVTTRNNRPSNWSTIKAQLASLYREFNSLENAFVYGSQNVDKLAENMQKMRNHLRKAVAEIRPQ